jgi:phosphosulfolactate synthase
MRPGQASLARATTRGYLARIGVPLLPPATCAFDPGYDPLTLECHLEQSAHLISTLKLSMACWIVADEAATRSKIEAARTFEVRTTTGGGPFEVAVAQGELPAFLELCADIGFDRIECGAGFVELALEPAAVVASAHALGLEVQYELGRKHGGPCTGREVDALIGDGLAWLEAGAVQLVFEARESATGVGLFDRHGRLDARLADRVATAFGLERVVFEAPTKPSQVALLDHFGPRFTSATSGSRSCSASRSTGAACTRTLSRSRISDRRAAAEGQPRWPGPW